MTLVDEITLQSLGRVPYEKAFAEMRAFTAARTESTPDEIWLVEHPPVYTLGQGAKIPILSSSIPVVQADRGGEITYHGPGQAVLYTLIDLGRRGIKVKPFVSLLEQSVIDLLGGRGERKPGAPGVYVAGAKVAALGIRVRRGRAYHGLALNVDMDLSPFAEIDPCGFPGLPVTQLADLGMAISVEEAARKLAAILTRHLDHA